MYAVDLHVASIMVFTVLKFPNVENCKLSSYFAFFKAKTKIKKVVTKKFVTFHNLAEKVRQ